FAPDAADAVEVRERFAQHGVELLAPLEQKDPSAPQAEDRSHETERGAELAEDRCHELDTRSSDGHALSGGAPTVLLDGRQPHPRAEVTRDVPHQAAGHQAGATSSTRALGGRRP